MHTGMNHQMSMFVMSQGLVSQPVQQLLCVRRSQQFLQGILLAGFTYPGSNCQTVNVVVAQHADGAIAQGPNQAQRTERVGATVDQVTREPEGSLAVGRHVRMAEQAVQGAAAALNITNRPDGGGSS